MIGRIREAKPALAAPGRKRISVSISELRIAQFPGFLAAAKNRGNCAPLGPGASAGKARCGAAIRRPINPVVIR